MIFTETIYDAIYQEMDDIKSIDDFDEIICDKKNDFIHKEISYLIDNYPMVFSNEDDFLNSCRILASIRYNYD